MNFRRIRGRRAVTAALFRLYCALSQHAAQRTAAFFLRNGSQEAVQIADTVDDLLLRLFFAHAFGKALVIAVPAVLQNFFLQITALSRLFILGKNLFNVVLNAIHTVQPLIPFSSTSER